ncbi:hypothetical protein [Candidatus Methanoperedens nitratireducens]|uniref:Uncharacterized protein n=1 Tax=Candidatus Methanoperedens nitratireducens TaxID=1392998 RepID=A0A284VPN3_9EURY|nr:hypothetical protein [Candidatus Methanoperedens nitroreducens]SNQ61244.1 conserved hypothetical protein [Candidatus Methanoperedens nitroreducens]
MIPLNNNEMLLLRGKEGTLGIVKVGGNNQFFLETEKEEILLALEPDNLLVASGFGTDEKTMNGLKCVLYMIREVGSPFIVLPKNHPASKRLKIVVSVGDRTRLSCSITPGTHPEQDILCGADEFDGMEIRGVKGGVEISDLRGAVVERIPFKV